MTHNPEEKAAECQPGSDASSFWERLAGLAILEDPSLSDLDRVHRLVGQSVCLAEALALLSRGLPLPVWLEILSWVSPWHWFLRKRHACVGFLCFVALAFRLFALRVAFKAELRRRLILVNAAPVERRRGLDGASYHEMGRDFAHGILRVLLRGVDPRLAVDVCNSTTLHEISFARGDDVEALIPFFLSMRHWQAVFRKWKKGSRSLRRHRPEVQIPWLTARLSDEYVRATAGSTSSPVLRSQDASEKMEISPQTLVDFLFGGSPSQQDDRLASMINIVSNDLPHDMLDRFREGVLGSSSGYPELDEHVDRLLYNLSREQSGIESEFRTLRPVLRTLTAFLGAAGQGATFKDATVWQERELQRHTAEFMRSRLGKDVDEHPNQAAGNVDIRYRGVVVELKVEDKESDRRRICEKYSGQVAAYEGVEARQVGVLFVLDKTEKIDPPGDLRNDILQWPVPTHGGADECKKYPTRVFVFVANGNLRYPSSYSR